ncbi:MAG: response regulator transcription factor, partial [Muribaculaceae bacterium]|nr:response regulator transcription factor [Muribaculaceae bacterium]
MKYDCLIIDDEKLLADSTAEYFNLFGVSAAAVYGSEECRDFFKNNSADLLLLDINLGDDSGFELCKELREKTEIPILFISARSSDDDKIIALNIGGDDYIQKPYSLGVLLAKVKAVLKRYGKSADTAYSDGRLTVDFNSKQVAVNGVPAKLTALEFKLLAYL